MAITHFCKDVTIDMEQRAYLLKQEIEAGLWQLEEVRTGRIHEFRIEELQRQYLEGKLTFPEDPEKAALRGKAFSQKSRIVNRQLEGAEWEKAKIRRMYAKAVEHLPSTEAIVKQAAIEVWQKTKLPKRAPHWTTVCRWKKQYLTHGKDAFALAEQHHSKGNHNARYPAEVIGIAEDCINKIYLQRERKTIQDTVEEAVVMVERENQQRPDAMQLPRPTRRLIERLIQKTPAFDRCAARYGRLAANRMFRSKLKHLITKMPLEAAEIDHTRLDLFVIDDDSLMPLGRPWLTICIDRHTRCILGIYIGFEPPSYLTVGKCLKHAFLPKVDLKQQYPEIRHDWEAHGVMEKLIVDNGLEFHSSSLEQACFSFGVEIMYTPRKTPWFKGMIERFNGTLNRGISHGIPGTTFSNIFEKDDYDPAKHAVMTLSRLRLVLHKWIADYYHQKPHSGLDQVTPATTWASSIRPEDIHLAHDPAEIDMLLGKAVSDKLVSHKGIEINNLQYNSHELMQLRRQRGDTFKIDIRVDESDLGHIYVMLEPGQGHIEAPALNLEYAQGLTLWLHKLCRDYAKKNLGKQDIYAWARAKTEIREIVEKELHLKLKKASPRKGRHKDTDSKPSSHPGNPQPKQARSRPERYTETSQTPLVTRTKPQPRYAPVIEKRA